MPTAKYISNTYVYYLCFNSSHFVYSALTQFFKMYSVALFRGPLQESQGPLHESQGPLQECQDPLQESSLTRVQAVDCGS